MNRRLKQYFSKLSCIHHPHQRRSKGGVGEVISRVRLHHIIIPEPGKPKLWKSPGRLQPEKLNSVSEPDSLPNLLLACETVKIHKLQGEEGSKGPSRDTR